MRRPVWELDVTGPAVAGVLVGLAGALALGPLGWIAWPATTAILVVVRYYSQSKGGES